MRRPARSCRSLRCRRSSSCRSWRSGASRPTSAPSRSSLGAIDVGLAWWALGRLAVSRRIRLATTVFFGFGTVALVRGAARDDVVLRPRRRASTFLLLAIGLALGADPAADDEVEDTPEPLGARARRSLAALAPAAGAGRPAPVPRRPPVRDRVHGPPDGRLRGAVLHARRRRRLVGPAVGLGGPRRDHPGRPAARLQPGDDGPRLPSGLRVPVPDARRAATAILGYHPDWGIEDPRYLPQNLGILFLSTPGGPARARAQRLRSATATRCAPDRTPDAGLFDEACPIADAARDRA